MEPRGELPAPPRVAGGAALGSSARAQRCAAAAIDAEALLVALVLVPSSFGRNRNPRLYADPVALRARRRAAAVRGIAKQLLQGIAGAAAEIEQAAIGEDRRFRIVYRVTRLGLRRSVSLTATEVAALRWVVRRGLVRPAEARRHGRVATGIEGLLGGSAGTRSALTAALTRMSPTLAR